MSKKHPKKWEVLKAKVLKDFDFKTVHKIMVVLDWEWASLGCVPNTVTLKKAAESLLDDAIKNLETREAPMLTVGSGGLEATACSDAYGRELELKFVLEQKTVQ